jgi:hypothetical protein
MAHLKKAAQETLGVLPGAGIVVYGDRIGRHHHYLSSSLEKALDVLLSRRWIG